MKTIMTKGQTIAMYLVCGAITAVVLGAIITKIIELKALGF